MTSRLICTSHAKINWWLKVGPVRPDGYHELETVFQELELGEIVSFIKSDSGLCKLTGFPPDIPAESNLVTKAWEAMRDAFPGKVSGVDVNIVKSLPMGGGLGGGSSNAACTIVAINNLYQIQATPEHLQGIGANLGADVAFFVKGGTAIGRGRGEILEQLPPVPRQWLVLTIPPESMNTGDAYRLLDNIERISTENAGTRSLSDFLTGLHSGDAQTIKSLIHNDFEMVAHRYTWFREAVEKLCAAGSVRAFLCGSGSTVAGLVTDENEGQRIAQAVGGILTSTRA